MKKIIIFLLITAAFSASAAESRIADIRLQYVNDSSIQIVALPEADTPVTGAYDFEIDGEGRPIDFVADRASVKNLSGLTLLSWDNNHKLYYIDQKEQSIELIPLWLSILPPLLAILLALVFREVVVSLFAGIWIGAFIANGMSFKAVFTGFLKVIDTYLIGALMDTGHLSVILFSLMIGGMVAVISRNGGMAGVVDKLSRYANSAKNSQLITWLLGIAIFFDDYANTLIVGNTMRPVTDKYRVSREKLAYIVDSTAAPVAAIAFVTTWIGAELGYIADATKDLGIGQGAYSIFFSSLQYSFYPIFTLFFMFLLIIFQKDFGAMYKAEKRTRETGKLFNDIGEGEAAPVDNALKSLDPVAGAKIRWYNALLPIVTLVGVTVAGLIITGYDVAVWSGEGSFFTKLSSTIGNADSYVALLWGSLTGVLMAVGLTLIGKSMTLGATMETVIDGFKTMMPAIVILVLAWGLAAITEELHTAEFLTSLVSDNVSVYLMPLITFTLAALISFSTGSSWSTMAILYPLIIPATWAVGQATGLPADEAIPILYNVIASVLAGSVLGDHCSPISDTTILSSLASGSNHIDHVRTQLPYALTAGAVSAFIGGVFVHLELGWLVNFALGGAMLFLVVKFFGKPLSVEKS